MSMLLLFSLLVSAQAETVVLTSGRAVIGEIIGETPARVLVSTASGLQVSFPKKTVREILSEDDPLPVPQNTVIFHRISRIKQDTDHFLTGYEAVLTEAERQNDHNRIADTLSKGVRYIEARAKDARAVADDGQLNDAKNAMMKYYEKLALRQRAELRRLDSGSAQDPEEREQLDRDLAFWKHRFLKELRLAVCRFDPAQEVCDLEREDG